MKIQIEFDESIIQAAVVEAIKDSFNRHGGTAHGAVRAHVEKMVKSEAFIEKVRSLIDSETHKKIGAEVQSEVEIAVRAITRKHAKRQAEIREAQIISAVGKQMELKRGV